MRACSYLSKVDSKKGKGRINVCYVYSGYDSDGESGEIISPQRIGGFTVNIDLPMSNDVITNPIHSPRGAEYWLMFWGKSYTFVGTSIYHNCRIGFGSKNIRQQSEFRGRN